MTISVALPIFLLFISDGTSYKQESVSPMKNELKAIEGDYQLTTLDSNYTDSCSQCVSSVANGSVYMIASCPTSWNKSQEIQKYCHNMNESLNTLDVWILTPVTAQSGITYKNMYCAYCHGEKNFTFWKILFSCTPEHDLNKPGSEILLDPNDVLKQIRSNGDKYQVPWQSSENTAHHCSWLGQATNDTHLKYCTPRSEMCTSEENCSNYASNVPDHNKSSNHTNMGPTECYQLKENNTESPPVNILNPNIIVAPLCHIIPQDSPIFQEFCQSESKSEEEKGHCSPSKCLLNAFYMMNESIILDNVTGTIIIKDNGYSYPPLEYLIFKTNEIYVCGSYIPQSPYDKFMTVLDSWITEILIKFSIICLVLHLLIFQQLPQCQNFTGKNLAIFCATLLVALLCFEIGPRLPSCEISAVLLHFSLLSCFTWTLLTSYDCWNSLRLATTKLQSAKGRHTARLYIYCIISWLIPALIVGVALYFEYSPKEVIPCDKKLAYGKLNQCFIGYIFGLVTFFIVPASCMFVADIVFFILTSFMIYGSQKNSVNPNSKTDFMMYTRLALIMGLTWILGSIYYLTSIRVIGILFSISNMSQGIFIFFLFSFKHKILKQLLEKHKKNEKVARLLQLFIQDSVTQTTNVESSSNL